MSNGPRYRGKTFHEYMSAKFWHPASKRNIVTVWKRKEQMKAEKRKHDERAEEARRENEKNMVASALGEKKAKLGVSFLYDMPNNIMPKGERRKLLYCDIKIIFRYKCTRKSR